MNEVRRYVVYAIIGAVILSTLFLIAYRDNILNNPVQASILAIAFFSAIAILIISLNPQLINPNRNISKIDDLIFTISILTYSIVAIALINGFGTDDMEYITQAITNLLNGKDPYTQFYHPVNVQPTYLISGKISSNFIYPPLSFLLYIPFYLFLKIANLNLYYINIVNIIFQDILIFLIYNEGKKRGDPIATLPVIFLFVTAGILAPSFAGVNGAIWATFIALSYIYDGKKSGIFLAMAVSFSQLAWLITPFLFLYKRQNLYDILKSFLTSIIIFNLPFFMWNPHAFLDIITLDQGTIPVAVTGFTIFNLTTLLNVEPWFFTLAIAVIGGLSLYIYFRLFPAIKESLWIFPMLILWFSWRTLTEYFLFWPELMFISIFRLDYTNKINIDITKIKRELVGVLVSVLFLLAAVGGYSHAEYIAQNPIKISEVIVPQGKTPINQVYIVVKNNANYSVNITLVRVSVPNSLNMVWNFTQEKIPPNSTKELVAFTNNPKLTINTTEFTVEVYYKYFISSYKVYINESNTTLVYENTTNVN
ncbi:hypothetical protein [Acidianus brierleyi]|uniref:Uncharacterized protein n=1 Tax=Acidianus brierleyi TaxID=41673 RepID=A0A2U9IBU4_9CREN|nr:hypothetical protein [Acidianus brierleyi]AWR93485.1 hypothetical protein DFR85_01520 [Acidianus brierleyi]